MISPHMKFLILCFYLLMFAMTTANVCYANAEKIYRDNNKAVVVIEAYDGKGEGISQGSGFIVRETGVIVTNFHVISNASSVKVKVGNKIYPVKGTIFIDKENDLAGLKIDGIGFYKVRFVGPKKVSIGQKVYVISSPMGWENTISEGILSGVRQIDEHRKILQITAPVSPGSSGGPVFNEQGEVIGVATAVLEEAQNINFAVPSSLIPEKLSGQKIISFQERQVENYVQTAEYWFNRGMSYFYLENRDKALQAFNQAIKLNPKMIKAYTMRVWLSIFENPAQALNDCKAIDMISIVDKIESLRAYSSCSMVFVLGGEYQTGFVYSQKAINLLNDLKNPDPEAFLMAYLAHGFLYAKNNNFEKAIEDFNRILERKERTSIYALAVVYQFRGHSFFQLGLYRNAIEDYNQHIQLWPMKFNDVYGNLALSYYHIGENQLGQSNAIIAAKLGNADAQQFLRSQGIRW